MRRKPTSAEAGMPELIAVNGYAVLAPADTPRPIVERLDADAVKVMNTRNPQEAGDHGRRAASLSSEQAGGFPRSKLAC